MDYKLVGQWFVFISMSILCWTLPSTGWFELTGNINRLLTLAQGAFLGIAIYVSIKMIVNGLRV